MLQKLIFSLTGYFVINLVIYIHETGHYLAAKLSNVDIDVVSFGIGKPIFRWTNKTGITEFRICLIPLGGYCKISGEKTLKNSIKKNSWEKIKPGTIYYATPIKRIFIFFAGSLLNLIFSILMLFVFYLTPYFNNNQEAKVVQMYKLNENAINFFHTNDTILEINNKKIENFNSAYNILLSNNKKNDKIHAKILRDGKICNIDITPFLNDEDETYTYGITKYEETIVGRVEIFSVEYDSGLRKNDKIEKINGIEVSNSFEFLKISEKLETTHPITLLINRDGKLLELTYYPNIKDNKIVHNFAFKNKIKFQSGFSLLRSVDNAIKTSFQFIKSTIQGILSIFSNINNLRNTFSGPARASLVVGQIADVGINISFWSTIRAILYIASMISASICFINLLPLPALDGSNIIICIIEIFKEQNLLKPKTYKHINTISQAFTIILLVSIWVSDLLATHNL